MSINLYSEILYLLSGAFYGLSLPYLAHVVHLFLFSLFLCRQIDGEKMIFKSYVSFDRWGIRTGKEGSGWQFMRGLRR